jgi:hypothetical protein
MVTNTLYPNTLTLYEREERYSTLSLIATESFDLAIRLVAVSFNATVENTSKVVGAALLVVSALRADSSWDSKHVPVMLKNKEIEQIFNIACKLMANRLGVATVTVPDMLDHLHSFISNMAVLAKPTK